MQQDSSESLVDGILQNIDGEKLQPEAKNGEALLIVLARHGWKMWKEGRTEGKSD